MPRSRPAPVKFTMITRIPADRQDPAAPLSEPAHLLKHLDLAPDLRDGAERAAAAFRLRVPASYLARIPPGRPDDPLLRQVLPTAAELDEVPGFVPDPLEERGRMPVPGLIHKYAGRVLLMLTGACPIHCRYCFRRHFPSTGTATQRHWPAILDYLRARPDVGEVILSGGDPLALTDQRLVERIADLAGIDHLRVLRLHTRAPVVTPERITPALLQGLGACPLQTVMVIHANHARELDDPSREGLDQLARRGVRLFNQAVLLRGVNDSVPALADLSQALFDAGVQPYYLHLLDPVAGAGHFHVPETEAVTLMRDLAAHLPGYLLPRLVREIPGQPGKTPVHG